MNDYKYKKGQKVHHLAYGIGVIKATSENSRGEKYYSIAFPRMGRIVDVFDEDALTILPASESKVDIEKIIQSVFGRTEEIKAQAEAASKREDKPEAVNHPSHYNVGKIEVIDFIEDKELGFNLGNAVKYIARAEHKAGGAKRIEDLRKAAWYINRQISRWEKEEAAE